MAAWSDPGPTGVGVDATDSAPLATIITNGRAGNSVDTSTARDLSNHTTPSLKRKQGEEPHA